MGPRGGSGGGGWPFYSIGQLTEPCASKGGCSPQDADTRYTHSCSPGPRLAVGARHPPCSQADTVIGRRPDIPRETHLHAWVTLLPPASSLCRQSELAVSCGRLEPVSMATRSCRPVASKRRKKVGRHRCGAATLVWCGRLRADRGSRPLRLELYLRSCRADSLHRWHLLGEPRSEGSDPRGGGLDVTVSLCHRCENPEMVGRLLGRPHAVSPYHGHHYSIKGYILYCFYLIVSYRQIHL